MVDYKDIKQLDNIVDQGTTGTKVAVGTTAQRGNVQGQVRYNTTTKTLETYNGSSFDELTPAPTLTSISPTTVTSDATVTFTIVGNNFRSGDVVSFIATNASTFNATSTTVNSNSSITAVASGSSFSNALDPYDVKITSTAGQTAELSNQISRDAQPVWSTAAGSVGTIDDVGNTTHATIVATDADGDPITYAETTSNLSGIGLTLNSNGTITGEPNNVTNSTTTSFDASATANGQTISRTFSITVTPALDGSTEARSAPHPTALINLGITTNGVYYIKPGSVSTGVQLYCHLNTSDNLGYAQIGRVLASTSFAYESFGSTTSLNIADLQNSATNIAATTARASIIYTDFIYQLGITGNRTIAGYNGNKVLKLTMDSNSKWDKVVVAIRDRSGSEQFSSGSKSNSSGFTGTFATSNLVSGSITGYNALSAGVATGYWDTDFIVPRDTHSNSRGMNLSGSNSSSSNEQGQILVS
jgi:hypothetical protein